MAGKGRKMAKVTLHPLAKPDDPIYNRPIMIGGRMMTGHKGKEGEPVPGSGGNVSSYDKIPITFKYLPFLSIPY